MLRVETETHQFGGGGVWLFIDIRLSRLLRLIRVVEQPKSVGPFLPYIALCIKPFLRPLRISFLGSKRD